MDLHGVGPKDLSDLPLSQVLQDVNASAGKEEAPGSSQAPCGDCNSPPAGSEQPALDPVAALEEELAAAGNSTAGSEEELAAASDSGAVPEHATPDPKVSQEPVADKNQTA
jgi:hypothetical protein